MHCTYFHDSFNVTIQLPLIENCLCLLFAQEITFQDICNTDRKAPNQIGRKKIFFLFEDVCINGHVGSPLTSSGSHLTKTKCSCKMEGGGKDQKLKNSFSEAAFGDSADSVWLKGKKAELDKQIYFSTLNVLSGNWIPVGKQVISSLGLKKMTSQNIGNLVAFYTIFKNFFGGRQCTFFACCIY